jgi:hypothetical protein
MPLILGANSVSGYTVKNSLRFNSGSSDYLNKTLPSPRGGVYKWTYSFWVKRSILSVDQAVTGAYFSGAFQGRILFRSDDQLEVFDIRSSSFILQKKTNRKFRDTSAWYHIVISNDNSVASPETEIYVNGVKETSFATNNEYSQNETNSFNNNYNNYIGQFGSGDYFNGYISEFYFIDGQALDPTDFGEFDSDTNIWKPKAYTGTFGANGFYLEFQNSAALGTDSSGNGNTFTVNNLTSIDQTTDTPTNNFATWNAVSAPYSAPTLTEGNLVVTNNSANWQAAFGTIAVSKSKWYWEAKCTDATFSFNHGVFDVDANSFGILNPMNVSTGYTGFYNTGGGQMRKDNATSGSYGTFANGDIMGIALDMDNKQISIYKNGTIHVSNFAISTGCLNVVPCMVTYETGAWQYNFGNPPFTISSGNSDANGYGNFEYTVPSGYYALNTKNLAEYA